MKTFMKKNKSRKERYGVMGIAISNRLLKDKLLSH